MSLGKQLQKDFSWMLAGNIVYSACQWLLVVVLAKLGNTRQVGEYALGMAIAAPVLLFANLQLRSLIASDVAGTFRFGQYLVFRLISLAAVLLIVMASVAGSGSGSAGVIALVCGAQAVEVVSDLFFGLMQKQDRLMNVSISLILRGPLSLAAVWAVMYSTGRVLYALAALFLVRVAVLLIWDARFAVARLAQPSAVNNLSGLWPLLRTAFPLGIVSMLGSLNANIPRYFVQAHLGSAELGIFSAVASLLSAGMLVVSAYGQAMFVSVANCCAAFDRAGFRKFILLAVLFGVALGASAILISAAFGRTILTRLFRPEYGEHVDVLVRVMIAGTLTFIALGLGFVMTAARSILPQVPLLAATGAAAVLGSATLVPHSGLLGAADAGIFAAFIQLAGSFPILFSIDRRLNARPGPLPTGLEQAAEIEAI